MAALLENKNVTILDSGRHFLSMVRQHGGLYVWVGNNGKHRIDSYGEGKLIVYDFERISSIDEECEHKLPMLENSLRGNQQQLLVVNELYKLNQVYPDWLIHAMNVNSDKGSVVLGYQYGSDLPREHIVHALTGFKCYMNVTDAQLQIDECDNFVDVTNNIDKTRSILSSIMNRHLEEA